MIVPGYVDFECRFLLLAFSVTICSSSVYIGGILCETKLGSVPKKKSFFFFFENSVLSLILEVFKIILEVYVSHQRAQFSQDLCIRHTGCCCLSVSVIHVAVWREGPSCSPMHVARSL